MSKWSSAFRDSRWQKKRLEIMQRDEFTCQCCGEDEGVMLNVHHTYYERGKAPWEYPDDTLITYCERCHEEVTKATRLIHRSYARLDADQLMALADIVSALCKHPVGAPYLLRVVGPEVEKEFAHATWDRMESLCVAVHAARRKAGAA